MLCKDFDLIIDKKIDSLNGLGYINLKTSKKVTTNKHISYIYQNNKIEYVSIYINDSILNFLNNNLDIDLECSLISNINLNSTINKKSIKNRFDLFGRKFTIKNQPFFELYNDGSVEKKIIIE